MRLHPICIASVLRPITKKHDVIHKTEGHNILQHCERKTKQCPRQCVLKFWQCLDIWSMKYTYKHTDTHKQMHRHSLTFRMNSITRHVVASSFGWFFANFSRELSHWLISVAVQLRRRQEQYFIAPTPAQRDDCGFHTSLYLITQIPDSDWLLLTDKQCSHACELFVVHWFTFLSTRIPSGIWSCLYGLLTQLKICAPQKSGPSSPKFFRGFYPLRAPIMPNFIEIGQTSLEKGGGVIGPRTQFFFYFVTDRQKRDYLSRNSQCARGATKNRHFRVNRPELFVINQSIIQSVSFQSGLSAATAKTTDG